MKVLNARVKANLRASYLCALILFSSSLALQTPLSYAQDPSVPNSKEADPSKSPQPGSAGGSPAFKSSPSAAQQSSAPKADSSVPKVQDQGPPPNEEKPALSETRLVIKNGKHFLVMDTQGMISGRGSGGFGYYADDTRYLGNWELTVNGQRPKLLSSSVKEGFAAQFIYSNYKSKNAAEETLLIERDLAIGDALAERLSVTNYSTEAQSADLCIDFLADFSDMFEVRGQKRKKRGTMLPEERTVDGIKLVYQGVDGVNMATKISTLNSPPLTWNGNKATVHLDLAPGKSAAIEFGIQTQLGDEKLLDAKSLPTYTEQLTIDRRNYDTWRKECASITTGDPVLNQLIDRAYRDLYILRQPTPKGWCISAGLPWFAVAFGRDELVTGLQTLPLMPNLSRDVLTVLANYQGTKEDKFTEERKGKIMHELRLGEMARCREIPFIPYYGTVDATPLWLLLMGRYTNWTGDDELARKLWPNVLNALSYLDSTSAGGFLFYGGSGALSNQGWKDSADSIMYSNGNLVKPPVALCEVQGYLYESWKSTARLAAKFGDQKLADQLNKKADSFREKFQKEFWLADKKMVALALDGEGKPCDVAASNAGHLLGTGILSSEQEELVAERLIQPDMFCGWGIRTLSAAEKRYNPMSYHDGSVWPHDNGMVVEGMSRAGKTRAANIVMEGVLNAASFQPNVRLPELYCGFSKSEFAEPVPYPVSCSPQAWAAGSMLQMLMASLRMRMDATGEMHINDASFVDSFGDIQINGLHVGKGTANILFPGGKLKVRTPRILEHSPETKIVIDNPDSQK